jgi:hypothetical protein
VAIDRGPLCRSALASEGCYSAVDRSLLFPSLMSDGKLLEDDARIFRFSQVFPSELDPVDLLSAACRAEFAPADKQRTGLSNEHPAILTSDQLSGTAVARYYARAPRARRSKNPPDKAKYEVGQYTIEYKSEKHWSSDDT